MTFCSSRTLPGPRIFGQRSHRFGENARTIVAGDCLRAATEAVGRVRSCVEEMVDEQRNVLAPFAQRRNDDVNDVEPVEQIFAELPCA